MNGHTIDARGLIADAGRQVKAMTSADDQRKTIAFPAVENTTAPEATTPGVSMQPGMSGPDKPEINRFNSTGQRFG